MNLVKRLFGVVCLAVAVIFAAVPAAAQSGVTVKLKLVEENSGEPVPFATVSLTPKGQTKAKHYVLTDAQGAASIAKVAKGEYHLKAEIMGYKSYEKDVVIDKKFSELSMVPHDSYLVYAIAAAIAAMGFSMIFNIQRRLLWVVAVGGIIAVCTRNFVNFELGYGPVIGSFMGSMVVSLIAVKAVHWFHVPNHVLTIPSVIPMIPGVLMYRALFGLINMHGVVGEVTAVVSNGITASLIILCIALGVAVPNIFARRYIAKDRQRFLQEELQKRRERGKFIEW